MTYDSDGIYIVRVKVSDTVYYNFNVYLGDIDSILSAKLKAVSAKMVGGEMQFDSSDDFDITGEGADFIKTLLTNIDFLETQASDDGTKTELKFKNKDNMTKNVVYDDDGSTILRTEYEFYETFTDDNNEEYTTCYLTISEYPQEDGSINYTITDSKEWWDEKEYPFTKNIDGTYTYIDDSSGSTYNITVDPGTMTYEVTIKAGDATVTDNVVTSDSGYTVTNDNTFTDTNGVITELLNGRLKVVETSDGLNTTLAAKDSSKLTRNGNNYTYTDGTNIYNFTKDEDSGVYTYTADNGVIYEVSIEKGDVEKIYNIDIQVSDGVYYINENGDGTLSLDLVGGYKITNDPDNSKFTDNFDVRYNDPADVTQITGPATTTVSVTNKTTNENYNTGDVSISTGVYNSLTKKDGSYSISAVKDNVTYNINIKTGLVVSDTRVPVTIDVANGKVTDGVFTNNGYDVSNNDIKTLLQDALEVVNVDGKTTVKLKDEISAQTTTNADGTVTYNVTKGDTPYTFIKNTDGTFTYEIKNSNGEIITYNVAIDTGDIATENNTDVVVTVKNGTVDNGEFTGNGYTVNNTFIEGLLNGNLKVIKSDDKTTVTVNNADNLTRNGDNLTYTAANGTPYTFTKTGDNQYTYTVTNGNNTTNYHVQIIPGSINSISDVPVTINVADGRINNGELTVINDGDKEYTIDNTKISSLLSGVLTIDKNSDGTATTLKFNDDVTVTGRTPNSDGTITYNVTKGGKDYTFTKNPNGSYTYTDNSNSSNVVNYIVTVDPGTLTYDVQVKVSDMTLTDDKVTSGGNYTISSDNNGFIADLLSGKVNVIETDDGLNTTLQATNTSALTHSGNNYTYTATDGKVYNFTKDGNIYTYTADNGAIYEVTLEQGDVSKNYNIGIKVSDGVYYISPNGEGTLSLEEEDGYTIEQSVGKDKFTDAFDVKYNDPADVTQITGPATTTVSVTNKTTGNNYKTSDVSLSTGVYNSLNKNADDGSYTISAVNGNITYNINIKTGLVVSDTTIPVTINVKDGKLTDGDFTGEGYSITNNDIKTLLDGKLEVVNVDGKTTVKFTDEVKSHLTDNGNGSYTYNDGTNKYDFTKNSDGTFTYEVENSNGETLTYNVAIQTGDIAIENNTDVIVTVKDGNVTDGANFTDNGYELDNDFIKGLLNGNLKVIKSDDKTTVTVTNADNLDRNGNNLTYTAANGTKYDFTKTGDNQYSYTVTSGNTTTNYHVTVIPGNINSTNHVPVTISVADGKISNGALTVVSDGGKDYTIDNENISTLLTDVLKVKTNSDGTGTTLEFTDGVTVTGKTPNSDGSTTYNVTKNGTPYTFTKNSDGTFTYTDNSNSSNVLVYNVTVDPGTLTYGVTVKAGDMTKTDNVVTSGGDYTVTGDNIITDSNGVISALLSGKLEVVETNGGLNTTLAAKDHDALNIDGNNYTYTADGKVYNFTKSGDVYTYTADNGVTYEVTIEKGNLNKIYNIGIQVSDGVYYINEKGEGTLSLDNTDGYKITNDPDNSKFTDNFSVKYNDPADVTQITGPATTTVSVTNKTTNENYNTGDVSISTGVYNSLTKNADGSYSISAVKDNVTYNINIKTGLVVSDTTIPVTINVKDGKLIDNKFTGDGYDVTNNDIKTLLQDALEVVNVDGKTTVKLKDEISAQTTTNADGTVTYNVTKGDTPYTFTKNSDGTFTYSVMNPNGEEINYHVTINNGDVLNENNTNVLVTVNNGTLTDGQFTGNGYDVDNDFIKGLLNGNLQVIKADDKTTVKVRNDSNLVRDGNSYTYTTSNGTPYTFTKTGDNQYTYTVTSGNTTTNYHVTVIPGSINSTNHVPVTISVGDGKINNGALTVVSDSGKDYTIDNKNIATLLTDVLTVDTNSDGTATTLKFTDDVKVVRLIRNSDGSTTYNVTKGTTPYTFTKNSDGTFTYTDNSDASNVLIYNVTVDPGTLTYGVTVKAGDITQTDNVETSNGGYTITNDNTITNNKGVIAELLNGKLEVVPTADGLNTTLAATDKNSLTRSGNNYTYTAADGKIYNFTKSGDVYTYTADNGVKYEVTLEKGDVDKIYNIGIQVTDGVFYINEKGEGTLSLDKTEGYTITNDPDNSNFAGNFNISYNEPLKTPGDTTQITGPYKTTVTVTNKNGNSYNTNDFDIISGGYNSINANKDGSYTISAVKDNVTYNINIKPGEIVSDTRIPVTINVKDGKVVDDNFTGNGYDVTNNDIKTLLDGKLEVVNVDGKTTVKFTDEVSDFITNNGDGSYTYNDGTNKYTYNKNTDGTFTYSVTNPNGEEIDYIVKIDTGNIATTNNVPVTINVADGKVIDNKFTGNGYDVTNDDIKTLLDGKLEVVNVDGKTTVKFTDEVSDFITNNGDGTYTYDDGTNKYTYNKNTDGTFTYSVTNPNGETTNYNVTVEPGDIATTNNIPVTINVKDGKVVDDKFTGNGYDVTNDDIKTLLDGKLEVVNVDGKTTVKFTDEVSDFITNNGDGSYTYDDGTNKYTYNKNTDGTFTYSVTNPNGETTNYNVTIDTGNITTTNNVPVTISVADGKISNGNELTVISESGKDYTVDNENISTLLTNVLKVKTNSDGTGTTLEFNDGVTVTSTTTNSDGSTTYNVTKGDTPYTFTKNSDGTFTYTDNSDASNVLIYNVTVDPGTLTYGVTVKAGDMTKTDNVVTSNGDYTVTNDNIVTNKNGVIAELLSGKLSVVETDGGQRTTLVAKDSSALTHSGNNYTYTDGTNTYNFTKDGDVYTYTADNGVKYEVTIEKGNVDKIYNIDIQVSDGVYYINEKGDGILSLGEIDGYTITKNPDNSNFTDNFSVKYNDPADVTQITGPATTTVSVTDKTTGNNYNTGDVSISTGIYNSLTKNADGIYTIQAVKDNVTYNINIKTGLVVSDTTIPVTINVKDGKLIDDDFTGNGYDVTNNDIKTLLDGKLEVVNVDGKTTVKFKDEVSDFITNNGDGTFTYNDGTNKYTYNKNTDGTFTYSVTNPNGEEIDYIVKIDTGDITTTNSVPVTISVGDGTITDGKFSGSTYDINDPTSRLKNLLGELTVTPTGDGNHTTINLPTGELLVLNDDGTYTYTYTGDDGNIIKYIITIDPGDISKFKNESVTVNVGNGRNDNGTFTSDGYTIPNDTIRNLLDGVITVTTTDNATTKLDFVDKSEGVFTDNGDGTFIYNKGGVNYPFSKTGDNKYTFSITGDDGLTTNYTITIQPGIVTNYLDENVSLKVGDGTLNDGEFAGNGYDVDNDLIGGLLSGELNVKYNRYKMNTDVEFANPENLTTDGTNYSYTKGGVTYNFTKNSDGTFNYSVTDGNTVTTYKVAIDPGKLTINNTPRETSTPSNNTSTSTPSSNTSTPSTSSTPSTPSNNNSSSSGGGGSSSTPTTPTNSVPTPVYTTTTPAQDTTTPSTSEPVNESTNESTNEPTNDISITSTPEVTISTPEPTVTTPNVDINSEPEPIEEIVSTPEVTPLEEIISTPEPTVTTPTDEIISEPESTQLDEIISTPTDETISEPELTSLDETISNTETIDEVDLNEPDLYLRSSQIEEFPEEKGDYIDLDSQDHILVETVDANESIFDIDVMPEEFNKVSDRNIVNDNSNSISNSPTADTGNANINTNTSSDNGGGLTSINTTPSNTTSSNSPSSTTSTGSNRNGGLTSISNNSNSNRNSNSRTTTSTENSNGNLATVNESQGDNSSTGDNDSSSTAVNLDGDLGAIESGRSDSSQEVSTDGNEQGTQQLSADNQNTQDTNSTSDNSTSQDSNSDNSSDNNNENDDENDRDNESEEE